MAFTKKSAIKLFTTQTTFFLFFVLIIPLVSSAQVAESDLAAQAEPAFNYYRIIEQKNFFRPKASAADATDFTKKPNTLDNNDFTLTGVIEIQNGYKAIVEQKSSQKGFYISVNDAIEDYTVKAILPSKIIIEKDGLEFELKLQQAAQDIKND